MALLSGSRLGTGPCPPSHSQSHLRETAAEEMLEGPTHRAGASSVLGPCQARDVDPFPSSALGLPQLCHTSAMCHGLLLWGAQHRSQGHMIPTGTILGAGGAPETAGSSSRRKGCSRKMSAWGHDALCQVVISSLTQHQCSWWELLAVFHTAGEGDQGDQIYWVL